MLDRLRREIDKRRMVMWRGFAALKTAQREADKAKTQIPAPLLAKLRADIEFDKGNLNSAIVSLAAAERFPPLRSGRP